MAIVVVYESSDGKDDEIIRRLRTHLKHTPDQQTMLYGHVVKVSAVIVPRHQEPRACRAFVTIDDKKWRCKYTAGHVGNCKMEKPTTTP